MKPLVAPPVGEFPFAASTTTTRNAWRRAWPSLTPWIRMTPMAVLMVSGGIIAVPIVGDIPHVFPMAAALVAIQVLVRWTFRGFPIVPLIGWPFLLFGIGFGPALLWSSFSDTAKILELFSLTLLAFSAPMVLLDQREDVLRLVVVAGFIGLVGSVAFLMTDAFVTMRDWQRLSFGEHIGSIVTGRMAGTAVIAAFLLALYTRHWWIILLSAPSTVVLVNTGALGPASAVALALVSSSIRALRHRGAWKRVAGLALLVAPVVMITLSRLPEFRLRRLLLLGKNEQVRIDVWHHVMTQSPWGTGWGDFSELGLGVVFDYAHNIFFETLAEGGIIALIAFTAVLGTAFYRSRLYEPAFTLLIYWGLNAMVSMSITGNRALLLTMGCCLALPYLTNDRSLQRLKLADRGRTPPHPL